ncbi:ssrA-binding protein [Prevotella sp. CAG:755]|nr:ssrA-binding protein [Prevotella sp. CAG:755]
MAKTTKTGKVQIKNRRAEFDYLIVDRYVAGIVLTGTEVKSIRAGKASLVDTFCYIHDGEVWVKNMYVAEYARGSWGNHAVRRDRKLLLQKKEIRQLSADTEAPGFTLVPLKLFVDENGRVKMQVGLCRGKKEYDKRQSLREKDDRREMDRAMKRY